jgi:hypothetical protein
MESSESLRRIRVLETWMAEVGPLSKSEEAEYARLKAAVAPAGAEEPEFAAEPESDALWVHNRSRVPDGVQALGGLIVVWIAGAIIAVVLLLGANACGVDASTYDEPCEAGVGSGRAYRDC